MSESARIRLCLVGVAEAHKFLKREGGVQFPDEALYDPPNIGDKMNDEVAELRRDFEIASKQVAKALTMNSGGAKAEVAYGVAYQALVRVGAAPQLRKKYRL